jgi:hypothetical protein
MVKRIDSAYRIWVIFLLLGIATLALADGPAPPGGWTGADCTLTGSPPGGSVCNNDNGSCFGSGTCETAFDGMPECKCSETLAGHSLKRQGFQWWGTCGVNHGDGVKFCRECGSVNRSWYYIYSSTDCSDVTPLCAIVVNVGPNVCTSTFS